MDNLDFVDIDYADIPWYRKRWALVIFVLFFCPAIWFLAATGDFYAKREGKTYAFRSKTRIVIVAVLSMISGAMRLMAHR
ncbi:hypothetical protein ACKC9G_13175 [Pokkaliibacter sp. CJK22405]|uniref:hypothetical protein n=1 Tax=Pokkaliibacter sp. CJK22405 TaxID=3384615 RepID=UPI00398553CD